MIRICGFYADDADYADFKNMKINFEEKFKILPLDKRAKMCYNILYS